MRVTLERLNKTFGEVVAVSDFSAEFASGELISLLGPSGCGKSTILNMLAGIVPATSGTIRFDGEDVTKLPPEQRGIGLVFQNYALYPHMTVRENICFPLEIQRVPKKERLERAMEIAKLVHVDAMLKRRPSELSGGQQQRVAIARALIKNPRLLLLDEPLSNLDARLRLEMREEIRRIQMRTGVTTIFVTHDQEEAMSISDRIVLMKAGTFQQGGLPQELYNQPASQFVADFLGNPPINNLRGAVRGGRFVLADGSASCALSMLADISEGRAVNLSIRAEAAALDGPAADALDCEVKSVYQMGREVLAYLRFGSAELRIFVDAEDALQPGDRVRAHLKGRGAFLFDAETGARVR